MTMQNIIEHTNDSLFMAMVMFLEYPTMANKKYGPIENWNTSKVTDMKNLISNAYFRTNSSAYGCKCHFNEDISKWDVSNVTDMSGMFYDACEFNQDLSCWNVTSVIDMSNMFYNACKFNKDISKWDVSNVADMSNIFGND